MRLPFAAVLLGLAALAGTACRTPPPRKAEELAANPLVTVGRLEQERAAAAALAPFTTSADAKVRARAVLALARLEHKAAAPSLLTALADADARVRANAAFGLG